MSPFSEEKRKTSQKYMTESTLEDDQSNIDGELLLFNTNQYSYNEEILESIKIWCISNGDMVHSY